MKSRILKNKSNIVLLCLLTSFAFAYTCSSSATTGSGGIPTLPTVVNTTTRDNAMITRGTIMISGKVTNTGNTEIIARGVVWSFDLNPTTSNALKKETANTFTSTITGLSRTTYHFRVYATNSVGTSYSENHEYLIAPPVAPRIIKHPDITGLAGSTTSIRLSASPEFSDGRTSITQRGFVYATSTMPTITDTIVPVVPTGNSIVLRSNAITLTPGNNYYFRIFATNAVDTVYGNEFVHSTHSLGGTTWTFKTINFVNEMEVTANTTTARVTFRAGTATYAAGTATYTVTVAPTATQGSNCPSAPVTATEGNWSLTGEGFGNRVAYNPAGSNFAMGTGGIYNATLSDSGTILSGLVSETITETGYCVFRATKN